MKFSDLDSTMRVFETAHDYAVLPDIYIVARLDGRGFTRLTRARRAFEAPFDTRFRNYMVATSEHLMAVGFHVLYGYTQSDEVSLLFDKDDRGFGRRLRKLTSVLAGEASAKFSLLLGEVAAFDCRVSQLPSPTRVVDYFRWRGEDAYRNALNAHAYWLLRRRGASARAATERLSGMGAAAKHELLYAEGGLTFSDLPAWQRRGIGVYWETYEKEGLNPLTGETSQATRKRLKVDLELPMREAYSDFVRDILARENIKR